MRDHFYGYYRPTDKDYESLWSEGVVVVDTSVLLNLYRLPVKAREEFLTLLERMANRIWIPHQVALEFQRSRLSVIAAEKRKIDDVLASTKQGFAEIEQQILDLEMGKRAIAVDMEEMISALTGAKNELIAAIDKVVANQLSVSAEDPIRERIDALLVGKVGEGPASQDEYDLLVRDGEARFSEKIPPGFNDAEKDKNPNDATFVFDGIKYQRKFGDLIVWRQLIGAAKSAKWQKVMLITGDRKDDWWWHVEGKSQGPRPELLRELKREAGVNLFWMYTSPTFFEFGSQYLKTIISRDSVAELEQVSMAGDYLSDRESRAALRAEQAVLKWLKSGSPGEVTRQGGFPDFVVKANGRTHGYEVKVVGSALGNVASQLSAALERGNQQVGDGTLSAFTLVAIVDFGDDAIRFHPTALERLERMVINEMRKYPLTKIVTGALADDELLFHMTFQLPQTGQTQEVVVT